jgi:hypothetical protein
MNKHEYINDFLYFVVRKENSTLVYCSGVNIFGFLPITKGRHGLGSNPALRGLQLVNLGIRDMGLSKGWKVAKIKENVCMGIAPTDEAWYTERLSIENAGEAAPQEIITYGAINLLKKIGKACMLQDNIPDELLKPEELQKFIETLCIKYGKQP